MRPAELGEGISGDALRRLGHQTLALELRIEPEAALITAYPLVGPQIDAADQLVSAAFQGDRPMRLFASRHFTKAICHVDCRAIGRVGPRNAGIQVANDFPAREAALNDRRIHVAQRAQDEARCLKHRRRPHLGRWHLRSRFRCRRAGPLCLTPTYAAGSGFQSGLDQQIARTTIPAPKGTTFDNRHARIAAQHDASDSPRAR